MVTVGVQNGFARVVAVVAAIGLLVLGIWAYAAPQSFFHNVATFPPYNRHLIHDIGAFLTGLGAVLVFGLLTADALFAALAGVAVGLLLHGGAHIEDRALGGRPSDPYVLSILGAIVAVAAGARAIAVRRAPRA